MPGSVVGSQTTIGIAEETTYGTAVTVNRWFELLSESLEKRKKILNSNGIRGGSPVGLRRGSRRVVSGRDAGGDITMEVATTGMGRWFKHILGGTPTIVQQGGTAAWLQTHSLGTIPTGLTVQKILRDATATDVTYITYPGCKVVSAEFSISVDQILQMKVTLDARDEVYNIAGAPPSFTNVNLFNFSQGVLTIDGTSVAKVYDASWAINNAQKVDSYYIGSGGLKAEPLPNNFREVTGKLSAEFDATVLGGSAHLLDRMANDSTNALVLTFTGAVIAGIYSETLKVTIPQIRFDSGTPKTADPGVIVTDFPFTGLYDGTNPGIKIEYTSTDTAV